MSQSTQRDHRAHFIEAGKRITHSGGAIPKMFVGSLLILFFILGSVLHIQTSEAFFMGGATVGLVANWQILR